jgi:hypothetical protein
MIFERLSVIGTAMRSLVTVLIWPIFWFAPGAELASVVSFLLQLGFRDVGVPFPITDLTPLEQGIASDMARVGLVFPFR